MLQAGVRASGRLAKAHRSYMCCVAPGVLHSTGTEQTHDRHVHHHEDRVQECGYSVEPVPIRCGHRILHQIGPEAKDLGCGVVLLSCATELRQSGIQNDADCLDHR
jgi:hypothetical protein